MVDKQVQVGLGVFIMDGENILMGLRKGSHGEGPWCFPGGHLEYGETWEACAARETMEETGLTAENYRYVAASNDIFASEDKHYITIFMMADYVGGEVRLMEPNKCVEWRWFTWDTMPENTFLSTLNLKEQGFDPMKV